MAKFKYKFQMYKSLQANIPAIYADAKKAAEELGIPAELKGKFGMTGGISGCPAPLRDDIMKASEEAAKKVTPLAVMVEGKFPALGDGEPADKTGRLLLIGSSKIFANDQIDNARYDDEKFILNSVADLVYGSEFAQAQSHGGSTVKGFGFVPPGKKLLWRAFAIAFAPFLFILYGLFRRLRN
jgi:hypothetical protein